MESNKEIRVLYRYDREYKYGLDEDKEPEYVISLTEHNINKTTPQGYWIKKYYPSHKGKFILSCKGYGKRYAYETKEQAFQSFKIRTQWSLAHSKDAVERAEKFLKLIAECKQSLPE